MQGYSRLGLKEILKVTLSEIILGEVYCRMSKDNSRDNCLFEKHRFQEIGLVLQAAFEDTPM